MKKIILFFNLFISLEVYSMTCQVEFSLPSKENVKKIIRSGITIFHPDNSLEEYVLNIAKRSMSLQVTQFLSPEKDPKKGMIVYDLNCSANLSCSGKRVYKSQLRDEVEEFSEETEKYASLLNLDNRNISSFTSNSGKMSLYFHKYNLKGKNVGVHFVCGDGK